MTAKPPASPPGGPATKPGRRSGYAEPQPRDGSDARQPGAPKPPDPDVGGLGRKPVETPDATDAD